MTRFLLAGAIAAACLAPVAQAQNEPITQKPSWTSAESKSALPGAGDVQLFLEAPPMLTATSLSGGNVTRGLGVVASGGAASVNLGINGGIGYFFTDVIEAGAAIALDYGDSGPAGYISGGAFEFGLEPFVKANLGRVISDKLHVNPFVDLGLQLGGVAGGGFGTGLIGLDLDLGVEFFVSRGWGISAFIPFALDAPTDGAPVIFAFGLGYGLVTYF